MSYTTLVYFGNTKTGLPMYYHLTGNVYDFIHAIDELDGNTIIIKLPEMTMAVIDLANEFGYIEPASLREIYDNAPKEEKRLASYHWVFQQAVQICKRVKMKEIDLKKILSEGR